MHIKFTARISVGDLEQQLKIVRPQMENKDSYVSFRPSRRTLFVVPLIPEDWAMGLTSVAERIFNAIRHAKEGAA